MLFSQQSFNETATYVEAFPSQFLSKLSQALPKTQLPQRFDWAVFQALYFVNARD
ncbi:MAG: hypothetical protein RMZ41_010305 [Nostoc sp. DedVER02]